MLSSRNLLMLAGLGALLAVMVVFAGVVTRTGSDTALPVADAAPPIPASPSTSSAPTTSSAPSAKTAKTARTDAHGFLGSPARCGGSEAAVAFGSTQRSEVAICAGQSGGYEYRGVRISDGATLTVAAESTGDGAYVATSDGAVYAVSPTELKVTSAGKVIYRDTWIAYEAPGLTADENPSAAPTTTAMTRPR